jgi:hypothetical protein
VLAVVVVGVEDVLLNRLLPVAAGLLPNRLVLAGVCDEAPNNPAPAPPLGVVVSELGVALVEAPNSCFCSLGFVPAFPNILPPPEVPDEAIVPLPMFPNEKGALLDWPPKRPAEEVVGVVDEPNSTPLVGALEVVALLLDCPEELGAPNNDIIRDRFRLVGRNVAGLGVEMFQ